MVDGMPFAKLIKYKLENIAYPISFRQTTYKHGYIINSNKLPAI